MNYFWKDFTKLGKIMNRWNEKVHNVYNFVWNQTFKISYGIKHLVKFKQKLNEIWGIFGEFLVYYWKNFRESLHVEDHVQYLNT